MNVLKASCGVSCLRWLARPIAKYPAPHVRLPDRRGEYPSIPRQRHTVEAELHPVAHDIQVVIVGARGHHGRRGLLQDLHVQEQAHVCAGRDDGAASGEGDRLAVALGGDQYVVTSGRDIGDVYVIFELSAGCEGVFTQNVIQLYARDDQHIGVARVLRGNWRAHRTPVGRIKLHAVDAAAHLGQLLQQAHIIQHGQRTRRQAIATRLIAREGRFIQ